MRKYLLSFIVFLLTFSSGWSQGYNSLWGYAYEVSFPVGKTHQYIPDVSFLDFSLHYRTFVTSNLAVGGGISWNVFNDRSFRTQDFRLDHDDLERPVVGTLTGEQFRFLNMLPIQITAHYYYDDPLYGEKDIIPFAGLGIGATIVNQRTEVGIFVIDETHVHFGLTPEAGIIIPFERIHLTSGVKYHVAFKTADTKNNAYFGVHVGLVTNF